MRGMIKATLSELGADSLDIVESVWLGRGGDGFGFWNGDEMVVSPKLVGIWLIYG